MAEATDAGDRGIRPYRVGCALLLTSAFLFRLWFIRSLPLSGDEVYHWEWSRNLAFGYYDHPGLTAYLIRFFTWLLGGSTELSVRLPALVCLTATAVVARLFALDVARMRGAPAVVAERAGFIACLIIVFAPIYAVFSCYISTDPPAILFTTLAAYLFFKALNSRNLAVWAAAGAAAGLAMMSKFLVFLLFPALLLFVLISPVDRVWFRRPHAYIAAACALAFFSPVLWWNATHKWATFMFNFVYRQGVTGINLHHVPEFAASQALALSPGVFCFAVAGIIVCLREWKSRRDRTALFLGVVTLVPLVYFLGTSFRRQIGLHWPAPAWIPAVVAASAYIIADMVSIVTRRLWTISLALCVIIIVAVHALVHAPVSWIEALSWKYSGDPARINTEELRERSGWSEMGERVGAIVREMKAEDGRDVFIFSGQYGVSAAVAFYTPGQPRTHLWAPRRVHGENYRFWDNYGDMRGQNGLFVAKTVEGVSAMTPELRMFFRDVAMPEELRVNEDGRYVRSFHFVKCYGFSGETPHPAAYEMLTESR